ncbi:hypothetical protein ACNKHM_10115 [Shigella sonnei]
MKKYANAANIKVVCGYRARTCRCWSMISGPRDCREAGFDPQGRMQLEGCLDLADPASSKIRKSCKQSEGQRTLADVLDATVARIEQLFFSGQARWRCR